MIVSIHILIAGYLFGKFLGKLADEIYRDQEALDK